GLQSRSGGRTDPHSHRGYGGCAALPAGEVPKRAEREPGRRKTPKVSM
ncbi:MAG: hypothetical protein AVDCRST_MAG23-47, partial [uncultured Sphingosinicella sp.]